MIRRLFPLVLLALGACTVGPNYERPKTDVPAAFAEAPPGGTRAADDPTLATWWTQFQDPELDRLVQIALSDSIDVKIAAARIRQARAERRGAAAEALPEVNATADRTHIHFSKNAGLSSLSSLFGGGAGGASGGSTGGASGGASGGGSQGGIAQPGAGITTYSVGFDASWELDIFGGVRRSVEAASAREEAAVWNARDAAVSLAGDVADAYLQLRLAQAREAVTRDEIARQRRSLDILEHTAQVGLVPQGDTARQQAQLAAAEATLPQLIAEQRATMHAIAVLLAKSPDSLIAELTAPAPLPVAQLDVRPGLPSDLLRRRPDIRAAERNLAAATADIGIAVADLYPKFSLTGIAELISSSLSNLFSKNSFQSTTSGAVNFPLLDFGRRKSQVEGRRAAADEAYLSYQRTVLAALRDVEDALVRLSQEQQRNASLRTGLAQSERATQAVSARFRTGLATQNDVLDTQANVIQARDQLTDSDATLRRDLVSLYKALGGGWSDAPAPNPPQPQG